MTNTSDPAVEAAMRPGTKPMAPMAATLRLFFAFTFGLFALGFLVAIGSQLLDGRGLNWKATIGTLVALALIAAAAWLVRSTRSAFSLPRSPKMRRSRLALYIAFGGAFALGIGVGITGSINRDVDNMGLLFSSAPITPTLALVAIAGWFVAMALSAYWHVTLDEIERAEYEFGGNIGMYAYVTIAPTWWLLGRASLAPEPDGMVIFWLVCIAWAIGWAWRRYR